MERWNRSQVARGSNLHFTTYEPDALGERLWEWEWQGTVPGLSQDKHVEMHEGR